MCNGDVVIGGNLGLASDLVGDVLGVAGGVAGVAGVVRVVLTAGDVVTELLGSVLTVHVPAEVFGGVNLGDLVIFAVRDIRQVVGVLFRLGFGCLVAVLGVLGHIVVGICRVG